MSTLAILVGILIVAVGAILLLFRFVSRELQEEFSPWFCGACGRRVRRPSHPDQQTCDDCDEWMR
jgi:hypothetical protein